jgi:hypothetical protein
MARYFWLTFTAILVIGCAKDIVVKPPTTLVGAYSGKCTVIRSYGSSNPVTLEEWIEWTFSEYRFWMKATRTDEKPQVFCDVSGSYSVTSNITFSGVAATDVFTCNPDDYPEGSFSIIQSGDSVSITGTKGEQPDQRYFSIQISKGTE